MKLNRRKVRGIIRQKLNGVATSQIALEMKVTLRRVQQIWKRYFDDALFDDLNQHGLAFER